MPCIVLLDRDGDGQHKAIVGFHEYQDARMYLEDWEERHPEGTADLEIIELHGSVESAKAGEVEFN
jgi:hypothetical protein